MSDFWPRKRLEKNYRARVVFNGLCEKDRVTLEDARGRQLPNLPAP